MCMSQRHEGNLCERSPGQTPREGGVPPGVSTASTSVRNGLHPALTPCIWAWRDCLTRSTATGRGRRCGAEPSQEQGCPGAVAAGGRRVEGRRPGDASLCALGSELAEQQQETKALLWELERGTSSCLLPPRDLDVGKERLHKLPFRELAEKDVPSCRQSSHARAQVCRRAWGWIWVLSSQIPQCPSGRPLVVLSLH